MSTPIKCALATVALVVIAGCQTPAATIKGEPAAAPVAAETTVALKGTVLEVLNASGYTYLNVETDGRSQWAAIPQSSVKSGDKVELLPGSVMHDVDSKALNRTFPTVVFSGGLAGADQVGSKLSSHSGMLSSATEQSPVAISGSVVESIKSGGYTYVSVEKAGARTWVAVPEGEYTPGQAVSFRPGMIMSNFKSKALDRTFDSIVFSDGLVPAKAMAPAQPQPADLRTEFHGKQEFSLEEISGKIADIVDASGYTYISVVKDNKYIWVATSPLKVAIGDQVAFQPGEVKRNYQSKKLKRSFPILVFSRGLVIK